ncbi:hypothetical protein A6R68_13544, partial [Neotoma lepida]
MVRTELGGWREASCDSGADPGGLPLHSSTLYPGFVSDQEIALVLIGYKRPGPSDIPVCCGHLVMQAVQQEDRREELGSTRDQLCFRISASTAREVLEYFSKADLEFHGVMRFYFQDKAAGNFATKCIRVSSTATTQDVIETLAEKFRPDMRMLSSPKYSLYEVHVSGEERRLDIDEKPLVVQLNWNKDDREGRFVLKNENDAIPAKKAQSNGPEKQDKEGVIQNFKRTLSKKEKKEKKKREKEALRQASDKEERPSQGDDSENSRLAAEVYKDMPETSFTRTISNPEVVMKRRRQQKLEKRMQEFRSSDGRPDSDSADFAVAESLEKYGLEKENPKDYCIARLKRRPPDYIPKKMKKHAEGKPLKGKDRVDSSGYGSALPPEKLPYLVELSPDGSDSRDKPKLYRLQLSVTEVGTEKFDDNSIQLFGPGIQPHHCDLTNMDGVVTVTPRSMDAETYVDGQRISETTMLQSGMKVQFGTSHVFKFVDPIQDHVLSKRSMDGGLMVKGPRHKPGTAERGMVKPMIRLDQEQDYRRRESRPDISPTERTHKAIAVVNKMVSMMEGVIQEVDQVDQKQKNIAGALAFWMANASELLNFIKQDRDLSRITLDAQDVLAHLVQMAFKLVTDPDSGLCSHYWGAIIRQQLGHIEAWAEKQGLELAADCHLSRIVQDLIKNVVAVAENTADELARSDGRDVQLEEDPDLQLPFLLPEDGYSCDVVRNIPNGLQEFLDPLCQR